MDPNYYESIVKHLTPKFIIDDRIEIEKELVEQFMQKFQPIFEQMNNKLKDLQPTNNTKKSKGKMLRQFGVNSSTEKHAQIDVSLGIAKDYLNNLSFYGVIPKEEGVSFLIEFKFKKNEYAEICYKEFKEKVEPRYNEFPYYQHIKNFGGNFEVYYKENRIGLEIFCPLEFYDELAKLIELALFDKFKFGAYVKLSLFESINLRTIQDLTKEEFFRHLVNRNIMLDIEYENYLEIFHSFLESFPENDNTDNDFGYFLRKIIIYTLIVNNVQAGINLKMDNEKLLDFVTQLGLDKTPIEYWANVIYEEAKELKQLFLDVLNNLIEHMKLTQDPENICGFYITRTLNRAKIGFSMSIFEV